MAGVVRSSTEVRIVIPAPSARFPTTAWSCIREAADPSHPKSVAAVNRLIAAYWRPVFYFLRTKGYPTADAEDLTQEFFTAFLTKGWLGRADPGKGRFRAFLKTLARNFAVSRFDRAKKQEQHERRYVSVSALMSDDDRRWEPTAGETPDEAFDRQWKAEVLTTVRRNLAAHYEGGDEGMRVRYATFAAYHPAEPGQTQPTREDVAARFGITLDAVRYALEEVGKRYARLLRQEVRDQVGSEAEVEAELRGLT